MPSQRLKYFSLHNDNRSSELRFSIAAITNCFFTGDCEGTQDLVGRSDILSSHWCRSCRFIPFKLPTHNPSWLHQGLLLYIYGSVRTGHCRGRKDTTSAPMKINIQLVKIKKKVFNRLCRGNSMFCFQLPFFFFKCEKVAMYFLTVSENFCFLSSSCDPFSSAWHKRIQ